MRSNEFWRIYGCSSREEWEEGMRDLGKAISKAFSEPNMGLTDEEAKAVMEMNIHKDK